MRESERDQVGATGIEVALLLALVSLVVLGAVQFLGSRSSSSLEDAHRGIAQPSSSTDETHAPGGSGGSSGSGGSGGAGGAGTVGGTSSTTATSSTTTVVATTVPFVDAAAAFSESSTARYGSSYWTASTTLWFVDRDGHGVAGAQVTLTVRTRRNGSSSWTTSTITVVTGPGGKIDLDLGPYRRSGSSKIAEVTVQVSDVAAPETSPWDGTKTTETFRTAP